MLCLVIPANVIVWTRMLCVSFLFVLMADLLKASICKGGVCEGVCVCVCVLVGTGVDWT